MKDLRRYCGRPNKIKYLFVLCSAFAATAVLLGIAFGSVALDITGIFEGADRVIFLYSRLPRVLACFVSGAALAVSGAVIQGVLSNRLASPSIIGVNSGAGLAVTVCAAIGAYGSWQIALFSFVGAFAAVSVIALGAKRWGASRGTVILAGVALNSLLNAFSSAIVTLDPDAGVMSNDFKVGDFSAVTYGGLVPACLLIAAALAVVFTLSNELDIMGLGDENARGLGVNTKRMRPLFLILVALLAGAAVSLAGLLSFVGLVVPHAVRMMGGRASKHLLPLSAIVGGGFVTLCDLVSRTAFAPHEIPVGIIMAFIGAPFFIFLLIGKGGGKNA